MTLLDWIIVIVILAWLTGTVVIPVGNVIHLLLVLLVIVVLVRLLQGRLP